MHFTWRGRRSHFHDKSIDVISWINSTWSETPRFCPVEPKQAPLVPVHSQSARPSLESHSQNCATTGSQPFTIFNNKWFQTSVSDPGSWDSRRLEPASLFYIRALFGKGFSYLLEWFVSDDLIGWSRGQGPPPRRSVLLFRFTPTVSVVASESETFRIQHRLIESTAWRKKTTPTKTRQEPTKLLLAGAPLP